MSQTKTQLIDGIVVDASGNVNIDSNTFYVDAANNRVGIGTTGPNAALDVRSASTWIGDGTTDAFLQFNQSATAANRWHIGTGTSNALIFYKGTYGSGSETARIDSSGRLLVGTSSARNFHAGIGIYITPVFEVEGNNDDPCTISIARNSADGGQPRLILGKSRATSSGGVTIVQSGDYLGSLSFEGTDGSKFIQAAVIDVLVDGTPGANDMPGRLVFSVTADGAASPTEAMRIKSTRIINFSNAPTFADNTAATAGGLAVGDVYKTVLGVLMIRF